ncbi:MAG TPA: DUF805 domain-containing protein [Allosphingosinicella sp.]|jgi:uncharacterized membrane protein YhaH (DUF805 family)|nr:DUF805 domain-containing protein [Allosphingosinicella sp.]
MKATVALRDHFGNAPLLWRTIRGTFDFTGRSRRTEVAYWYIAFAVLNAAIQLAVGDSLSQPQQFAVTAGLGLLFLVPLFALFARRVHDHSRSGWWVLALFGLVEVGIYDKATEAPLDQYGSAFRHTLSWPLTVIELLLALAVLALLGGTETIGPNRYGPDPREGT